MLGFPRRRKSESGAESSCSSRSRAVPPGVEIPGHLGDLWGILQRIAEEEDPSFKDRSIVEHFNSCAEGQRDVARWLSIYQRRVDPTHHFELPPHWRRHRGHVLVARNWPEGVLWQAIDESSWRPARCSAARTEAELVVALDALLGPA